MTTFFNPNRDKISIKPVRQNATFFGRFLLPKDGGTLVDFATTTEGGASFFLGGAKKVTIGYHVTTGISVGTSRISVVNVPDANFPITIGTTQIAAVSPGSDINSTAGNLANAINASAAGVSAVARGEFVHLKTAEMGIQVNNTLVRIFENSNTDGAQRFSYFPFFVDGESGESSNITTFNLYGKHTRNELVGKGVSLFDTASSTGRTGTNVLYTLDESIISPFEILTATWAGLTAGDQISIFVTREF